MSKIMWADSKVAYGGVPTKTNIEELHECGVKTVICLTVRKKFYFHDMELVKGNGMTVVHMPIGHSPTDQQKQVILKTIEGSLQYGKVYVHCWKGVIRAPLIAKEFKTNYPYTSHQASPIHPKRKTNMDAENTKDERDLC